MRLFLLADSSYHIPQIVVYQKILDIINAGKASAHLHYYIVGDHFPTFYKDAYEAHSNVTLLKKYPAEKLISEVTNAIVVHFGSSLKGSQQFPQYFIPLSGPSLVKNSSLFQKLRSWITFKGFIKKATSVFATNTWAEFYLNLNFAKNSNSIQNAFLPISGLPQLEWVSISAAKQALTQGADYYLALVAMDNFVNTLKEFSIFKKWQHTSMALVFVWDTPQQMEKAVQLQKGYKYRNAVIHKLIEDLSMEELAGTYAILWGQANFDKIPWMEWAIQFKIPMMLDTAIALPDPFANAGEVFNFQESRALSNHFKLYYKDEVYRQTRANLGSQWHETYLQEYATNTVLRIPIDLHS
jgi:hypothetical protein